MSAYETFASVYDLFMEQVEYDEWLDHIHAVWKKYGITPKTILDLGCGTGSILLPLAQEGFDVIGVDLSPEMLTEADHKAMEAGVSVRLACQDMTELDLGEQADCILSLCDCMNYLIEDGQLESAFQSIAAHMKKESLFLFDMNTEYKYTHLLADGTFAENREESSFIWENFYDEDERINEYDLTLFIKEGELFRKFEETHYQRCYSLDEVKEAAKEAGMEFVAAYDAFTRKQVKDDSERVYLVFRERGK